ncbi:hypothetical protein VNO78_17382 [Psophocarpus tetragonolobus]|uniref:Uncharacterized protein n=1 Tax=Psophocarpus tetragonolobus TaxID=3891 RepID=A0AAN9SMP9_PSOTE
MSARGHSCVGIFISNNFTSFFRVHQIFSLPAGPLRAHPINPLRPKSRIRFHWLNLKTENSRFVLKKKIMAASGGSFLTLSSAGAIRYQHVSSSQPTTLLGVCPKNQRKRKTPRRFVEVAVTQGSAESSKSEEKIPSWAKPDSDEPPPWARDEPNNKNSQQEGFEIPFYAYLLASAITAIAAIGSIFEYVNQRPVFGVLTSDSVFYAPLLGFFVFTGIPSSAFLWFKSVQAANKEAEEQDKRDGYL